MNTDKRGYALDCKSVLVGVRLWFSQAYVAEEVPDFLRALQVNLLDGKAGVYHDTIALLGIRKEMKRHLSADAAVLDRAEIT